MREQNRTEPHIRLLHLPLSGECKTCIKKLNHRTISDLISPQHATPVAKVTEEEEEEDTTAPGPLLASC